MFGTTIAIALDIFYMCVCVCVSYFLQGTFYDERRNPSLPSLPQILSLAFLPWMNTKHQETLTVSVKKWESAQGEEMFHGVSNTSNLFLSLCGHDLVTSVLGQGKGLCIGQN